ncbi:MAG: YetF domain-containing protein [Litorilinea sp.]
MFFDSWAGLVRVILVGLPAYGALILWLRLSGKRTLSKWNAFDFVVTVALGSTLATVIMSKDIALAEGVLAFVLLIGLQFVITWLAVRFQNVRQVIKSQPTLLLDRGRFLEANMQAQRVNPAEIRAAVRGAGISDLEDVEAVVLEADGSFSVVPSSQKGGRSALEDVDATAGR